MSSIFSTQTRQPFLRRKYCFLPVAIALSPPVGRCEAAMGRPPLSPRCSAIVMFLLRIPASAYYGLSAGGAGGAGVPVGTPGAPGTGDPGSAGNDGEAAAGAEGGGAGLRA